VNEPDEDHAGGQPLELILARNLISILSLPAVLVDARGRIVFFNEAAEEVIGAPFQEVGVLEPEEWNARYGPLDAEGKPLPREQLPLRIAVRESRPAYGRYFVATDSGLTEVEIAAVPLTRPGGYRGAVVVFCPVRDEGGS
jgi:PAS domain-containing protein